MGRYTSYNSSDEKKKRKQIVHPVWRGVGLALIFLTPFLGYVGALAILQENEKRHWFALPADLMVRTFSDPLIAIKLILTVIIAFVLYILFSFIVFSLYSAFAPPRYGPLDAPAPDLKGRKMRNSR